MHEEKPFKPVAAEKSLLPDNTVLFTNIEILINEAI